ncbi:hypothetical protein [Nitrosococcus watsonii]|uniref:NACHT domain-containing protein n=1 Tax=Nitrosococcus watsoni (strain C-113) TaxID=105559 RepID=D8K9A6_NITWC|nr:hypothetical protein [Nitrosococcus watsonii]ADJ29249.1 hypothetical protein Nwat_2434 [Nitrosococcus watsonii C-113]
MGTPQHPVPFGGREEDLARLDAWLEEPNHPPYRLLAAPAGRGKSALLARWSRRLLEREDLAVAFFPVSIRFGTNLARVVFTTLAARLAKFHGKPLPAKADPKSEDWQGLVADYLAQPLPGERRLLVILDGLDEAAGWEAGPHLFPFNLPATTRMVVSARYVAGDKDPSGWQRRLNWDTPGRAETMTLEALTPLGVADVLTQMAFPLDRLGANVDIVAELYRLSAGDPLLVKLYVDDLWAQGEEVTRLRPEDLRGIRPGLEGFFKKWWDDQRQLWEERDPFERPVVEELFNLLSCALGPLNHEDMFCLASSSTVRLTTRTLDGALKPLKRFIMGDGRSQGYVFSHPRLGIHFYEQLSKPECEKLETRFLSWGEETLKALNQKRFEPKAVSPYVVQYYGAHLERANQGVDAFLPLVSDGWRQAWLHREGAYGGFLSDVQRVWRKAVQVNSQRVAGNQPAPYLGLEIRCALCQASINSLAGNIPSNLLLSLVQHEIWSPAQGLAYVRQVPDKQERVSAFRQLVPHLRAEEREEVLGEALAAARAIEEEGVRAQVLRVLINKLVSLSCAFLYPLWQNTLPVLASQRRSDFLNDIRTLTPLIAKIGGQKAVEETFRAIRNVMRWWP